MLKSFIKSAFWICGFDIHRKISPPPANPFNNSFDAQKILLSAMGIAKPVILDIGAHRGETAERYRSSFPRASIYCFEPFPQSSEALRKKFSNDPDTTIISSAVADRPGQRLLHVNEIDQTNSLLPEAITSRRYLPKQAFTTAMIEAEVTSIDEFVRNYPLKRLDILKMDVQGGELMALEGAAETLKRKQIHVIYSEIMFVPHYENQPLLHEIWNYLSQFGYTLFGLYDLRKATNGQLRYGDALFVSENVRRKVIDGYPQEP
jgi:FkbM family methyltransferase